MPDSLDTLIAFVLIMTTVSMLVTIAVQMVSSLFNLRGMNVAKGLSETFHTINPELDAKTHQLAKNILTGAMISDSNAKWLPAFWRVATAVRPAEAFDALHRIAIGQKKSATEDMRADARTLLISLGVQPQLLETVTTQVQEAGDTVKNLKKALEALAQDKPEVSGLIETVTARLQAYSTNTVGQIEQGSAVTVEMLDQAYQKFEYWFEIGQERAQQWFTVHARGCTIVLAIVFAFWLQLDSIEIFKLVSTNRAVRDQLVAQAGTLQTQAAKVLGDSSTVLQAALIAWSTQQTDKALADALLQVKGAVTPTDSREQVQAKVETALAGRQTVGTFNEIVNQTATDRLKEQAGNFNSIKTDLDKTGFELYPKGGMRWVGVEWSNHAGEHFWGMVCSAALLSLGAPFWFNLLKGLMNLRSAVAENISGERKEDKKQPGGDKPGPAPVTVVRQPETAPQPKNAPQH